jgi:hypothetical protein
VPTGQRGRVQPAARTPAAETLATAQHAIGYFHRRHARPSGHRASAPRGEIPDLLGGAVEPRMFCVPRSAAPRRRSARARRCRRPIRWCPAASPPGQRRLPPARLGRPVPATVGATLGGAHRSPRRCMSPAGSGGPSRPEHCSSSPVRANCGQDRDQVLATYQLGVAGAVEVGGAQGFLADDRHRAGVVQLAAPVGGDDVCPAAAPDRESHEPLDWRGNPQPVRPQRCRPSPSQLSR